MLDGESPRTIVVDPRTACASVFCDKPNSTTAPTATSSRASTAAPARTTITPSNGVLAFTYSAPRLLAYFHQRRQRERLRRVPGNGSTVGSPGFGVYGDARCSYAGSIGAGTAPASTKRRRHAAAIARRHGQHRQRRLGPPSTMSTWPRRRPLARRGLRLRHRAGERRRRRGVRARRDLRRSTFPASRRTSSAACLSSAVGHRLALRGREIARAQDRVADVAARHLHHWAARRSDLGLAGVPVEHRRHSARARHPRASGSAREARAALERLIHHRLAVGGQDRTRR